TSVKPEGRFGSLEVGIDSKVERFTEKPQGDGQWINGGFFVCDADIFKYLSDKDSCMLEKEPLEKLAQDGKIYSYKHHGFWRPMDTLRDKNYLEELWKDKAPWKTW